MQGTPVCAAANFVQSGRKLIFSQHPLLFRWDADCWGVFVCMSRVVAANIKYHDDSLFRLAVEGRMPIRTTIAAERQGASSMLEALFNNHET